MRQPWTPDPLLPALSPKNRRTAARRKSEAESERETTQKRTWIAGPRTVNETRKIPQGSEDYRRRNPHLFLLGELPTIERQQDAAAALVKDSPAKKPGGIHARRSGRARPVIEIVVVNRRQLDSDNLDNSCKGISLKTV
jgi:hypothetical protein